MEKQPIWWLLLHTVCHTHLIFDQVIAGHRANLAFLRLHSPPPTTALVHHSEEGTTPETENMLLCWSVVIQGSVHLRHLWVYLQWAVDTVANISVGAGKFHTFVHNECTYVCTYFFFYKFSMCPYEWPIKVKRATRFGHTTIEPYSAQWHSLHVHHHVLAFKETTGQGCDLNKCSVHSWVKGSTKGLTAGC